MPLDPRIADRLARALISGQLSQAEKDEYVAWLGVEQFAEAQLVRALKELSSELLKKLPPALKNTTGRALQVALEGADIGVDVFDSLKTVGLFNEFIEAQVREKLDRAAAAIANFDTDQEFQDKFKQISDQANVDFLQKDLSSLELSLSDAGLTVGGPYQIAGSADAKARLATLVEHAMGRIATITQLEQRTAAAEVSAQLAAKARELRALRDSRLNTIQRFRNPVFDESVEEVERERILQENTLEANRLQEELDTFLRGEASVGLNSARAKLGTGFPLDSDKFSKLRTEFEKFKTEFGIISLQNGGPLAAGQLALVGEAGPELFVPGTAGNVLKNEDTMAVLAAAGARALQEGTADLGAFGSAVGGAVAAGAGLFGALFGLDEDGKPLTPEGILEKAAAVREGLAEQKALLAA